MAAHPHAHLLPLQIEPDTEAAWIFQEAVTLAQCGGILESFDDPNMDLIEQVHSQMAHRRDEACRLAGITGEDYYEAICSLVTVWCKGSKITNSNKRQRLLERAGIAA